MAHLDKHEMNRTKIEYGHFHWALTTGCDHGPDECATSATCWARNMAHRFHRDFVPTLHPELLDAHMPRKPSRILVSFGGDAMSKRWAQYEPWPTMIDNAQTVMEMNSEHSFLWLTKNPRGYSFFNHGWPLNAWLGASITGAESPERQGQMIGALLNVDGGDHPAIWVSYEPMLGPLTVSLGGISWLVIGAQGGPGARAPQREWVAEAKYKAEMLGIPIWLKRNLRAIFPELPALEDLPQGMVSDVWRASRETV